LVQQLNK